MDVGYITLSYTFAPQSFLTTLNITHFVPSTSPSSHICSPHSSRSGRGPPSFSCSHAYVSFGHLLLELACKLHPSTGHKWSHPLPLPVSVLILLPLLSTFSWLTSTAMLTLNCAKRTNERHTIYISRADGLLHLYQCGRKMKWRR